MSRIGRFLAGEDGAGTPFMPIFMRFGAKYAGTPYRDFILDSEAHCRSNLVCAEAFGSDWVNVMSDPYCELEAYGAEIEYPPDSLPLDEVILYDGVEAMTELPRLDLAAAARGQGRLEELRIFRRELGDSTIICGWIEGPVAEYCDLRSLGNACFDFYDAPETVAKALELLYENAKEFAARQIEAGANCIGIGDAACSQLGPELYEEFGFRYERELVRFIHDRGALVKLHICGNTTAILPRMLETGADIVDVDHLVRDMAPFAALLKPGQALCGNLDPVSLIQDGSPAAVRAAARTALSQVPGRLILSGGCEITPGTPVENLMALKELTRP